jgi:glyoxylase-like metal-dependent hydrolase (beta-lactamase superfamily II)
MTSPVFANSATVDAAERLVLRGGAWAKRSLSVRYGLFLSQRAGPVLIDTGYTRHAISDHDRGLGLRAYSRTLSPRLVEAGQPEAILARFGIAPRDVTLIVVSHFHADHVSGLRLFPKARFLTSAAAWTSLTRRSALANLRHGIFLELLPPDFADRLDLIEDRALTGPLPHLGVAGHDLLGDGTMVSVPLPGHAPGHVGILFPQMKRPLPYAVDAQWLGEALPMDRRPGFPATLVADDRQALDHSSNRVESFAKAGGDVVLCHDPAPSPHDLPGVGPA